MPETKESRVAFVVIKLKVRSKPHFLMRTNEAWGDVSFVGGHVEECDGGLLKSAAYRELLEEVPPLKTARRFELEALTPELHHGPVYSPSAKTVVVYDLQFFHVLFHYSPERIVTSLRAQSLNVLVAQDELLEPNTRKIATLVGILNDHYDGGLSAIPYSWPQNIELSGDIAIQSALVVK